MKHLSLISVILFALLFTSCSKDEVVEPTQYGKLAFSIKSGAVGVKSTSSLGEVTHAIISIKKGGSIFQDFKLKKIKLTDWGSGNLVSDEIKLWVGSDYRLTRFELQNKDNKTLYAAPLAGSALASKVSKPLDIAFGIDKDKSTPLQVEVLSVAGASPAAFGFVQFNVKVVTDIDKDMVFVKGGVYNVNVANKHIVYDVTLKDYFISKFEVTQEQWLSIMGTKPRYGKEMQFRGGIYPVTCISWDDVQEFILKLNKKTGRKYRLPTEAEWIYAAIGGNKSNGYKFAGSNILSDVANIKINLGSKGVLKEVGSKNPNELGLYDMSGNVWEYCLDKFTDQSNINYSKNSINPIGLSGNLRIYKGGSYSDWLEGNFYTNNSGPHPNDGVIGNGTTSNRQFTSTSATYYNVGFRLVCDI